MEANLQRIIANRQPKASLSPTSLDIAWAAGLFEGEGYVSSNSVARIAQNDKFIVNKLQSLFGGSIREKKNPKLPNGWVWTASGSRGRGFFQTIFTFLSPRRKEQVKVGLR